MTMTATFLFIERRSQFRVRAILVGPGLHPFCWEIYDDEDGKTVHRSRDLFRSSTAAWHAGAAVLEGHVDASA